MGSATLVSFRKLAMITAPYSQRVRAVAPADDPAPASLRLRMPAEWAQHEATWLSWPHNRETWPGCFEAAEAELLAAVRYLAEAEPVHVNALDSAHASELERRFASMLPAGRVHLHVIPTNDAWIRDHGAIFVTAYGAAPVSRRALDFGYNAWGGKYPPFDLDNAVPAQMAAALDVPCIEQSMVLEGGSIDVNGEGVLLTTEQCLLNPNRNPALKREAIEACLRQAFGVTEIIWLGGGIDGDDTDGHIDELTRFVSRDTVLTAVERDASDPNHAPLEANRRILEAVRIGGRPLQLVELPMPKPLHNAGQRLPASYANFYIANGLVLLPGFADPADDAARSIVAQCFPDRQVVQIDCRHLVAGLGGLHCLTQQVPASPVGLS